MLPECTPSTCLFKALEQVVLNVPLKQEAKDMVQRRCEARAAAASILPETRLASGRHRTVVSPSRPSRPATSGGIPNTINPWRTMGTLTDQIGIGTRRPASSARASRQVLWRYTP